MADDLILQPDGICGGTAWWNNYPAGGARSCLFSGGGGGGMSSALLPSYCSVGGGGDGGYGWLMSSSTDDLGIKGNLMTPSNFYDDQQQQQLERSSNFYDDIKVQESYNKTGYGQPADQTVDGVGGDGVGGLMDASATTLHEMIGFELSPSSSTSVDWNQQSLFSGATADESYNSIILQENQANITRLNNYEDSNFIQKEWKTLDSPPSTDQQQRHHQQAMNSGNCSTSSGDSSTVTYEAAATGGGNRPPLVPTTATTPTFPMNSYSSPSSSSPLIQNMLADQVLGDLRPQASLFSNDYSPAGGIMNNNNNNNYVGNFQTNGLVNGGPGHNLLSTSTAAALEDIRATLLGTTAHNYIPHHQPPTSNPNLASKVKNVRKDGHEPRHSVPAAGSSKGRNNNEQPAFKRPRIDTPSPLPTFKVRKEKLGDRITALQQLVSPFGKTDTASVLQEAIEYIKFLHEQVHVLTTPYLKTNGVAQHPYPQQQQTVNSNKQGAKEREVGSSKQDLRSRGLCLVPLSTTFPVASETPVDFWTPTFGSTFR